MKLKSEFDTHGQEPVRTEYRLLSNEIQKLSYHIGRSTGAEKERLLEEYNRKRKLMLKMPCTAQTNKRLKYIRYAPYPKSSKNSKTVKRIEHME